MKKEKGHTLKKIVQVSKEFINGKPRHVMFLEHPKTKKITVKILKDK